MKNSMQIKSKSGRMFHLPSDEEDAAIRAGIAADPDTREVPYPAADAIADVEVEKPARVVLTERDSLRVLDLLETGSVANDRLTAAAEALSLDIPKP